MSKYGHRTGNWLEAVVNKVGGEEAADALLRGELVVTRPVRVWETWKTVRLGTFKNVDEIYQALKVSGNNINNEEGDILGKPTFTVSKTEKDVELINVSVEELGLKDNDKYKDICKRAFKLGLQLCPAEVGPQLRLQWKDQPKGTHVIVAMKAIFTVEPDLSPRVFLIDCSDDGKQNLSTTMGSAHGRWYDYSRFVFLRRK